MVDFYPFFPVYFEHNSFAENSVKEKKLCQSLFKV